MFIHSLKNNIYKSQERNNLYLHAMVRLEVMIMGLNNVLQNKSSINLQTRVHAVKKIFIIIII